VETGAVLEGITMGRYLVCLVAVPLWSCGPAIEYPPVREATDRHSCDMPWPPPADILVQSTNPAHCLPTVVQRAGITLRVMLSADGRAIDVSKRELDLCLPVTPEEEVRAAYELDAAVQRCILEDLKGWRFGTLRTCQSQHAYVWMSGADVGDGRTVSPQQAQAERGLSRGGPTSGCS
jgi:hypothetical protein